MARLKIKFPTLLQELSLAVKGLVDTNYLRGYKSAFKGQGLEFANFRFYSASDDASRIDWKTSGRTGKLIVKEFVEERNLNVVFLLDVSSKMMLGSAPKLKVEYAAELVSSFAFTILNAGDSVGLTMFSDKIMYNLNPSNGVRYSQVVFDALTNLSYYGGDSNVKEALNYALKNLPLNSLVILVSDFIGENNFLNELKIASKKFDFIGIMVRDPIDVNLPKISGQVLVEDPVTGEKLLINPKKISNQYNQQERKEVSNLSKMFLNSGADFLQLYTDKLFAKELGMFFERRKLGWR